MKSFRQRLAMTTGLLTLSLTGCSGALQDFEVDACDRAEGLCDALASIEGAESVSVSYSYGFDAGTTYGVTVTVDGSLTEPEAYRVLDAAGDALYAWSLTSPQFGEPGNQYKASADDLGRHNWELAVRSNASGPVPVWDGKYGLNCRWALRPFNDYPSAAFAERYSHPVTDRTPVVLSEDFCLGGALPSATTPNTG